MTQSINQSINQALCFSQISPPTSVYFSLLIFTIMLCHPLVAQRIRSLQIRGSAETFACSFGAVLVGSFRRAMPPIRILRFGLISTYSVQSHNLVSRIEAPNHYVVVHDVV